MNTHKSCQLPGVYPNRPNKLKVLFITTWDTACGIATYSANLIEQLEKTGDVTVEVFSNTQSFGELIRLAKASDADIVHFQHEFGLALPPEPFLSIIGKLKSTGKKVVITSHTEDDMFNTLMDGVADALILHNDGKDMVHRNTFSYFEKIPHGIPVVTFKESRAFYRKKYDIPEDAFVVGTCGFLAKNSIQEVMVPLIKFAEKHKDVYINLVTSAHSKDGGAKFAKSIKESMMALATKHGIDRIFIGLDFMPTQEFRERIYTMDVGFAMANPALSSNSGAAADIVSCGVSLVVNDCPHFSHLKKFVETVPEHSPQDIVDRIEEMYNKRDNHSLSQDIGELSYAAVANQHIALYNKVMSGKKEAVDAPLIKDKPITVAMPSDLWKVLLLWPKLHTLIVAGYKLNLSLQNDGPTDVSMLQFVLGGIANISFEDIGMVKDPYLYKITSHKVAQKMSVDLASYLRAGREYEDLFPDIRAIYDFPITLGDYAKRYADKMTVDTVFSITPDMIPEIRNVLAMSDTSGIILMASPLNADLIPLALEQVKGYVGNIKVIVEDTRTRWAVANKASRVVTGWDDVAAYCLLKRKADVFLTTEAWQDNLISHWNQKTGGSRIARRVMKLMEVSHV